jgi:hypothetical protein
MFFSSSTAIFIAGLAIQPSLAARRAVEARAYDVAAITPASYENCVYDPTVSSAPPFVSLSASILDRERKDTYIRPSNFLIPRHTTQSSSQGTMPASSQTLRGITSSLPAIRRGLGRAFTTSSPTLAARSSTSRSMIAARLAGRRQGTSESALDHSYGPTS